jgi:molybdate transport system substrate-binding protein
VNKPLELLCAGAAQGLVKALQERFFADTGASVNARFGAVGAIKEFLLAGEACDVMVVTEAMIDALSDEGHLQPATRQPLGRVRTGLAVRSGEPRPDVSTPELLKAALLAADAIYFPDPVRATAGIHFANVMRALGIHDELQPRFRNFPNGATSMRELAATNAPRQIGCTQITEINYTEGIDLLGALPDRFELATVYTAAANAHAAQPELASRFIALLAGADSLALRQAGGFEF